MRLCLPMVAGILLLSLTSALPGQTPLTVKEIVEQFFPQRLIDESEEDFQNGGPRPFKASAFRLADLDGVGTQNYIVAAYTNGFSAAIRILLLQDGSATFVTEPNLRLLAGIRPALQLVDIENDGRPEVVAFFSQMSASTADWVFKWTGTELSLIGPASIDERGDAYTSLVNAGFRDVDGDGILEIITPPQDGIDTYRLYSFDGQKYNLTTSLNFFQSFFRRTGAPVVDRSGFDVQEQGDDFIFTIINGTQDGSDRVSSGVIRLNGVVIAGPTDFSQEVGQIVREVSVLQDNVVEVELQGKPLGRVIITVEPPQN